MVIFHSYVKLPEGNQMDVTWHNGKTDDVIFLMLSLNMTLMLLGNVMMSYD